MGTASWTDRTLLESRAFYPKSAKTAADRLRYYARHFPVVEVDATYYALPSARNAAAWAERTPADCATRLLGKLLWRMARRRTGVCGVDTSRITRRSSTLYMR